MSRFEILSKSAGLLKKFGEKKDKVVAKTKKEVGALEGRATELFEKIKSCFVPKNAETEQTELTTQLPDVSPIEAELRSQLILVRQLKGRLPLDWYEQLAQASIPPQTPAETFQTNNEVYSYLGLQETLLSQELFDTRQLITELAEQSGDTTEDEIHQLNVTEHTWKSISTTLESLSHMSPPVFENSIGQLIELNDLLNAVPFKKTAAEHKLSNLVINLDGGNLSLLSTFSQRTRNKLADSLDAMEHTKTAQFESHKQQFLATLFTPRLLSTFLLAQSLETEHEAEPLSPAQMRQKLLGELDNEYFNSLNQFHYVTSALGSLNKETGSMSQEKQTELSSQFLKLQLEQGMISAVLAKELQDAIQIGDQDAISDVFKRVFVDCFSYLNGADTIGSADEIAAISEFLKTHPDTPFHVLFKELRAVGAHLSTRRLVLILTLALFLRSSVPIEIKPISTDEIQKTFETYFSAYKDVGKSLAELLNGVLPDHLEIGKPGEKDPTKLEPAIGDIEPDIILSAQELLALNSNLSLERAQTVADTQPVSDLNPAPGVGSETNPTPVSPEDYATLSKQVVWQMRNFTAFPAELGTETYTYYDPNLATFVAQMPDESDSGQILTAIGNEEFETLPNVVFIKTNQIGRNWMYVPNIAGYQLTAGSILMIGDGNKYQFGLEVVRLPGDRETYVRVRPDQGGMDNLPVGAEYTIAFAFQPSLAPDPESSAHDPQAPFLEMSDLPPDLQSEIQMLSDTSLSEKQKMLELKEWFLQFGSYSLDPKNDQRAIIDILMANQNISPAQREKLFYQLFYGTSDVQQDLNGLFTDFPQPGAGECNRRNQSAYHAFMLLGLKEWRLELRSSIMNGNVDNITTGTDGHLYLTAVQNNTGEVINLDVTGAPLDSLTTTAIALSQTDLSSFTQNILPRDISSPQGAPATENQSNVEIMSREIPSTPEEIALFRAELERSMLFTPNPEIMSQAQGFSYQIDGSQLYSSINVMNALDINLDQLPWIPVGKDGQDMFYYELWDGDADSIYLQTHESTNQIIVDMPANSFSTKPFFEPLIRLQRPEGFLENTYWRDASYQLRVNQPTNVIPFMIPAYSDGFDYTFDYVNSESIKVTLRGMEIDYTITAQAVESLGESKPYLVLRIDPKLLQGQTVEVSFSYGHTKYEYWMGLYAKDDIVRVQRQDLYRSYEEVLALSDGVMPEATIGRFALAIALDSLNYSPEETEASFVRDQLLPPLPSEMLAAFDQMAHINDNSRTDAEQMTMSTLLEETAAVFDTYFADQFPLVIKDMERYNIIDNEPAPYPSTINTMAAFLDYVLANELIDDSNDYDLLWQFRYSFTDAMLRRFDEIHNTNVEILPESLTAFSEGADACAKISQTNTEYTQCLLTLPEKRLTDISSIVNNVAQLFSKAELSNLLVLSDKEKPYLVYPGDLTYILSDSLSINLYDDNAIRKYYQELQLLRPDLMGKINEEYLNYLEDETYELLSQVRTPEQHIAEAEKLVASQQEKLSRWWLERVLEGLVEQKPYFTSRFIQLFAPQALALYFMMRSRVMKRKKLPNQYKGVFRSNKKQLEVDLDAIDTALADITESSAIRAAYARTATGASTKRSEERFFRLPQYLEVEKANPWRDPEIPPTYRMLIDGLHANKHAEAVALFLGLSSEETTRFLESMSTILEMGLATSTKRWEKKAFKQNELATANRDLFAQKILERIKTEALSGIPNQRFNQEQQEVLADFAQEISTTWEVIVHNWREFNQSRIAKSSKKKVH